MAGAGDLPEFKTIPLSTFSRSICRAAYAGNGLGCADDEMPFEYNSPNTQELRKREVNVSRPVLKQRQG
jgi:hypothetical protein